MQLLVIVILAGWIASVPRDAAAATRHATLLRDRFPQASVVASAVTRSDDGAMWFGTETGLFRYDGARYTQVAPGEIRELSWVCPYAGGIAVGELNGRLGLVRDGSVEWLELPTDAGLESFDTDGEALWVLLGTEVYRYDGSWQPVELPNRILQVTSDAFGALALGAYDVWVLSSSGIEQLSEGHDELIQAATRTEDALWVATVGYFSREADGVRTKVLRTEGRPADFVVHDGVPWATTDAHVIRFGPAGPLVTRQPAGQIAFDREGSLWLTSFFGPIRLAAPDTVIYTTEDGLPANTVREATMVDDTIFVSTWGGLARWDEAREVPVAIHKEPTTIYGSPCSDEEGNTWGITGGGNPRQGIVHVETGDVFPVPGGHTCVSAGGWAWLWRPDDLVVLRGIQRLEHPLPIDGVTNLKAREGLLWLLSNRGDVCSAEPDPTRELDWDCETAIEGRHLIDLWVAPSGNLWLGTRHVGLWRGTEAGWAPVELPVSLPGVRALRSSPRGGVWVSGGGRILRIEDRGDDWVVRESLRPWHGLRPGTAGSVLETEGGDLWISSSGGLVHVPVEVRDGPVAPPIPAWAQGTKGLTEPIERDANDNNLVLEFTAHALRDPFAARYRYRLGPEQPWSEPQQEPRLVLAGMAPGSYEIALQASADGELWVDAPVPVLLTIRPPWYSTWWFRLAVVAFVAGVTAAIYRIRVAAAMRLHAQRTRIAADLHDEVGSTLSAIRLTASAAASHRLPADRAMPMFERIAETSSDLGVRLRDIVWCLRADSGHLLALARFVEQRARQLLPEVELHVDVQCTEPVPLSLPVLRSVQLVALEALHNASKHARAHEVRLSLVPEGKRWRLEIEDDGTGEVAASDGLGLTSMRSRAAAIGATLELDGRPGRGTRVSLTFHPRRS